jgi:hypothetical protein
LIGVDDVLIAWACELSGEAIREVSEQGVFDGNKNGVAIVRAADSMVTFSILACPDEPQRIACAFIRFSEGDVVFRARQQGKGDFRRVDFRRVLNLADPNCFDDLKAALKAYRELEPR